jgi:ATP-grasp domain, R2K clade family 3
MRFIFPSDYFHPKQVDEAYLAEYNCLQNIGFETSVISLESLESGVSKIYPLPDPDEKIIYRGWMLAPNDYSLLVDAVKHSGADMWIDRDEYLRTHYLPNWYPLLHDLTPETHCFDVDDRLESKLNKLGWDRFFVKDYVKSLKTSTGSIINSPSAINSLVAEMQKFRDTIEGGICVRQVEDFITETERRYFVINDRIHAASPEIEIPAIATECARRIDSKFFSIDCIDRRDGRTRIVEIGDGQVSGLVGWTVDRFANLWDEFNIDNLK